LNYLPRLASNHNPPDLCLLSSQDYRRAPSFHSVNQKHSHTAAHPRPVTSSHCLSEDSEAQTSSNLSFSLALSPQMPPPGGGGAPPPPPHPPHWLVHLPLSAFALPTIPALATFSDTLPVSLHFAVPPENNTPKQFGCPSSPAPNCLLNTAPVTRTHLKAFWEAILTPVDLHTHQIPSYARLCLCSLFLHSETSLTPRFHFPSTSQSRPGQACPTS
jgi:hypothetical protein